MTLLDRIIPPEALRWGRMTTEPVAWHLDSLRYTHAATQAEIARLFAPAWRRLGFALAATLDAVAEDAELAEWRRRYLTEQDPM